MATVVLDRPDRRNCQDPALWAALHGFARDLTGEVRVVVVRGEGPSFSAGLDRALFATLGDTVAGSDDDAHATLSSYQQAFTWLRRPSFVSIAAVQGHAVGAGFQLALACDLRIAADDAQFAMAEVGYGIVPDLAGTHPLVAAVGRARALEWCATGRRVGAQEALAAGLVNRVVPAADLEAATAELTQQLLAPPRDAVIEVKALVDGAGSRTYDEQCEAERDAQLRRLRDLIDTDLIDTAGE
ncbi:MAG: enoyl-CoA hydratase/isomerase family protein [Mycobacteriales bacterium]|nr:enoyl-CoA hydratase/isomerase family protein [Mycobacteriales bacterium]